MCATVEGYDNSVKIDKVFGFIILFAKHYIYQCKRNMSLPRVDIFQKQLQLRYKVKEYNAKILSRDNIFYKSWCNYEALLSESWILHHIYLNDIQWYY